MTRRRRLRPSQPFGEYALNYFGFLLDMGYTVEVLDDTELSLNSEDATVRIDFDPYERDVQTVVWVHDHSVDAPGLDIEAVMAVLCPNGLELGKLFVNAKKHGFDRVLESQALVLKECGRPLLSGDFSRVKAVRDYQRRRTAEVMPWMSEPKGD
jgi:hypothetical protein